LFSSCSPFLCYCSASLLPLHSFPTRRSSDLVKASSLFFSFDHLFCQNVIFFQYFRNIFPADSIFLFLGSYHRFYGNLLKSQIRRSEEHTSELQSRFDLVCRLLLDKKKKVKNI